MEKRISDYILHKLNPNDDFIKRSETPAAYGILIHIAFEMIIEQKSEQQIKDRIDRLLTDPVKTLTDKQP